MPKAPLLGEIEIEERLRGLPGWERRDQMLVKVYRFADFTEAVDFVVRLREPANEQNHHPDVTIHWNEVTLALWTHASGGLTERDFRLARTLDELLGA